jgi:hypothetical protein
MMNDRMIQLGKRLTLNSTWAVDSTFKTDQYNVPLFGVVCPNEKNIGIPVFLMLYSNNKNSEHEGIALQLTMRIFFEVLKDVRLLTKTRHSMILTKSLLKKIHIVRSKVLWEGHKENVIFCCAIFI